MRSQKLPFAVAALCPFLAQSLPLLDELRAVVMAGAVQGLPERPLSNVQEPNVLQLPTVDVHSTNAPLGDKAFWQDIADRLLADDEAPPSYRSADDHLAHDSFWQEMAERLLAEEESSPTYRHAEDGLGEHPFWQSIVDRLLENERAVSSSHDMNNRLGEHPFWRNLADRLLADEEATLSLDQKVQE